MMHQLSDDDRRFLSDFENGAIAPAAFNHAAHVRLAYAYLVNHDVEDAVVSMRDALLRFLDHNGVPRMKYHETLTRAWILAVRHFMDRCESAAADEFMERSPQLLDSKTMLTHYSAELLFSADARAAFVEPDLDPIRRR
jgi:hypothetical protein